MTEKRTTSVCIEGPNGGGKTAILELSSLLTNSALYDQDYIVGTVAEPPRLPIYGYEEMTYRQLLKSGEDFELLFELTNTSEDDESDMEKRKALALARGFMMYREILSAGLDNIDEWDNLAIEVIQEGNAQRGILFRDRGVLSTLVFQDGSGTAIAEVIHKMIVEKTVRKDDVTFVVLPSKTEKLRATVSLREGETDIHEQDSNAEVEKYAGHKYLEELFAERVIVLENDESMGMMQLVRSAIAMSTTAVALRLGYEVEYFDGWKGRTKKICYSPIALLDHLSAIENKGLPSAADIRAMIETPSFEFEGIPLSFVVGDYGFILPQYSSEHRGVESGIEFILVEDLKDNVIIWEDK